MIYSWISSNRTIHGLLVHRTLEGLTKTLRRNVKVRLIFWSQHEYCSFCLLSWKNTLVFTSNCLSTSCWFAEKTISDVFNIVNINFIFSLLFKVTATDIKFNLRVVASLNIHVFRCLVYFSNISCWWTNKRWPCTTEYISKKWWLIAFSELKTLFAYTSLVKHD